MFELFIGVFIGLCIKHPTKASAFFCSVFLYYYMVFWPGLKKLWKEHKNFISFVYGLFYFVLYAMFIVPFLFYKFKGNFDDKNTAFKDEELQRNLSRLSCDEKKKRILNAYSYEYQMLHRISRYIVWRFIKEGLIKHGFGQFYDKYKMLCHKFFEPLFYGRIESGNLLQENIQDTWDDYILTRNCNNLNIKSSFIHGKNASGKWDVERGDIHGN